MKADKQANFVAGFNGYLKDNVQVRRSHPEYKGRDAARRIILHMQNLELRGERIPNGWAGDHVKPITTADIPLVELKLGVINDDYVRWEREYFAKNGVK